MFWFIINILIFNLTISFTVKDPAIIFCFSEGGSQWTNALHGIPNVLLTSHTFQFLPGDPMTFAGQMRSIIISPLGSRSTPRSPPSWACPESLQRRNRKQNHVSWLLSMCRSRVFTLRPVQVSLFLSLSQNAATLWRRLISVVCISDLTVSTKNDFVTKMWTQLSHWLYKDLLACNSEPRSPLFPSTIHRCPWGVWSSSSHDPSKFSKWSIVPRSR